MAKMFSHPLLTMNPLELMKLWGELVEAYHGVHGYGSDTAEIYAYRLMPYNPLAHSESVKGENRDRNAGSFVRCWWLRKCCRAVE